jgi:hypothetical protein
MGFQREKAPERGRAEGAERTPSFDDKDGRL